MYRACSYSFTSKQLPNSVKTESVQKEKEKRSVTERIDPIQEKETKKEEQGNDTILELNYIPAWYRHKEGTTSYYWVSHY